MLAITKTFSHTTFATEEKKKKKQAFGTSYHPPGKPIIITTLPTNLSRYDWGRSLHQP